MGLEFQSRGFLYLRDGDAIDDALENYHFTWVRTGGRSQFCHFCEDGKSQAYAAAHQVRDTAQNLSNSTGFFSLSADCCDVGLGFDRAYILHNGFREINTRTSYDETRIDAALHKHFLLCFHIQYDSSGALQFLAENKPPQFTALTHADMPIAAWLFNHQPVDSFEPHAGQYFSQKSIQFTRSGGYEDQYLMFGDVAKVDGIVSAFQQCTLQFQSTVGMGFILQGQALQQLLFFRGQTYNIGLINPSAIEYHTDIKFRTGRHGYTQRCSAAV